MKYEILYVRVRNRLNEELQVPTFEGGAPGKVLDRVAVQPGVLQRVTKSMQADPELTGLAFDLLAQEIESFPVCENKCYDQLGIDTKLGRGQVDKWFGR